MREYYLLLGISEEDSKETMRRKYIELMRKYHPDKNGDKYLNKCKKINEAYNKIMGAKDINGEYCGNLPGGFKNWGFKRVPTLNEYVRRILTSGICDDKNK